MFNVRPMSSPLSRKNLPEKPTADDILNASSTTSLPPTPSPTTTRKKGSVAVRSSRNGVEDEAGRVYRKGAKDAEGRKVF